MNNEQQPGHSEVANKIKTIRAYYKLCQKPEHRNVILKVINHHVVRKYSLTNVQDKTFFNTLPVLLKDANPDVIKYTVKVSVRRPGDKSGNV